MERYDHHVFFSIRQLKQSSRNNYMNLGSSNTSMSSQSHKVFSSIHSSLLRYSKNEDWQIYVIWSSTSSQLEIVTINDFAPVLAQHLQVINVQFDGLLHYWALPRKPCHLSFLESSRNGFHVGSCCEEIIIVPGLVHAALFCVVFFQHQINGWRRDGFAACG